MHTSRKGEKTVNNHFKLYGITNRECLGNVPLIDAVKAALEGGITCIQYREKRYSKSMETMTEEEREELINIRRLCKVYQVPFIVNDNIELAKMLNADGVHIGRDDEKVSDARKLLGEEAIIGVTAKTVDEAMSAYENGASYLGCGAVFGSQTKKEAKPMEIGVLKDICNSVPIPVVAIGGITLDNLKELGNVGIAGVAIIKGIFGEKDIEKTCKRYIEIVDGIVNKSI